MKGGEVMETIQTVAQVFHWWALVKCPVCGCWSPYGRILVEGDKLRPGSTYCPHCGFKDIKH